LGLISRKKTNTNNSRKTSAKGKPGDPSDKRKINQKVKVRPKTEGRYTTLTKKQSLGNKRQQKSLEQEDGRGRRKIHVWCPKNGSTPLEKNKKKTKKKDRRGGQLLRNQRKCQHSVSLKSTKRTMIPGKGMGVSGKSKKRGQGNSNLTTGSQENE